MADELHRRIVKHSLENCSNSEFPVSLTFGEAVLFHTLLQDYGLELVDKDKFIPLMERSKARVDTIGWSTPSEAVDPKE